MTLITGASSGIGEAFARRLAAEKHSLMLVARSEEKLRKLSDSLSRQYGVAVGYSAADLTSPDAITQIENALSSKSFEVDWLINNAGFGSAGDFARLDLDAELKMIKLNISSLVSLTHHFILGMRTRRSGTIINVSSAAAFQPVPFMATYAATKAFVSSFSEAIAEENRPFGIRVLALCPGPTETNFFIASKIDDPIQIKGVQTSDAVVDAALKAVRTGRMKIVSGWANYAGAVLGTFVPSSISTRIMGRALRQRFQKDA
ncbi:MAG: SDR family oxidoreductase [Acidobacteriota bacterium]